MSRDELAFKILLTFLANGPISEAIQRARWEGGLAPLLSPADLFARAAFKQADSFITAGAPGAADERTM